MKIRFLVRALTVTCLLAFALPVSSPAQVETVKVKVKRLLLDPSSKTPVVVLESLKEKKFIPIWSVDHTKKGAAPVRDIPGPVQFH